MEAMSMDSDIIARLSGRRCYCYPYRRGHSQNSSLLLPDSLWLTSSSVPTGNLVSANIRRLHQAIEIRTRLRFWYRAGSVSQEGKKCEESSLWITYREYSCRTCT